MTDRTDTLLADDTDDTLIQLDTVNEILFRTEDYARRIHFWVRLWSALTLAVMALAIGLTIGVVATNALGEDVEGKFNSVRTDLNGSTNNDFQECLSQGSSPYTCDYILNGN